MPDTVDPPLFCPRCERPSGRPGRCPLVRKCGERLQPQGFCPTCERHRRLPIGVDCPKHELPLGPTPTAVDTPQPPDTAPDWVTVGRYNHPIAAEAPRIHLEAEGIRTLLDGARMGGYGPHDSSRGGVRLQVPPRALTADARVLLA